MNHSLENSTLSSVKNIKDLGVNFKAYLTWNSLFEQRLKKANKVLYFLKRNIEHKDRTFLKLGLYKSLILPVLLLGLFCADVSRGIMRILESFQKRAVKWIIGSSYESHGNSLRLLKILPITMFLQGNDILLSEILQRTYNQYLKLPPETTLTTQNRETT